MYMNQIKEWYEEYRVGIYRFALSILKDPDRAEDVLQETFMRLLQGDSLHFEPGKEKAWLYRVARNQCYDILRKQRKESSTKEEPGSTFSLEFIELIAPLNKLEREIVSLKILGNLTHKEIAQVMKLTERGAQKRYERALQKLREGI